MACPTKTRTVILLAAALSSLHKSSAQQTTLGKSGTFGKTLSTSTGAPSKSGTFPPSKSGSDSTFVGTLDLVPSNRPACTAGSTTCTADCTQNSDTCLQGKEGFDGTDTCADYADYGYCVGYFYWEEAWAHDVLMCCPAACAATTTRCNSESINQAPNSKGGYTNPRCVDATILGTTSGYCTNPEAVTIAEALPPAPDVTDCTQDSDACLQGKNGWSSSETCADSASTGYCVGTNAQGWVTDMMACCPAACTAAGVDISAAPCPNKPIITTTALGVTDQNNTATTLAQTALPTTTLAQTAPPTTTLAQTAPPTTTLAQTAPPTTTPSTTTAPPTVIVVAEVANCETMTAAETAANLQALAVSVGQSALLDVANSVGTCQATASARRARRANDFFAATFAFFPTVTPTQIAAANTAVTAATAAPTFAVQLSVGGATQAITAAQVTVAATAAVPVTTVPVTTVAAATTKKSKKNKKDKKGKKAKGAKVPKHGKGYKKNRGPGNKKAKTAELMRMDGADNFVGIGISATTKLGLAFMGGVFVVLGVAVGVHHRQKSCAATMEGGEVTEKSPLTSARPSSPTSGGAN